MSITFIGCSAVFLFAIAALIGCRYFFYAAQEEADRAVRAAQQCADHAKALGADIPDNVRALDTARLPVYAEGGVVDDGDVSSRARRRWGLR